MKIDFIDALVLQSVYHSEDSEKGAELNDIIAYADYVNHAILTFDELEKALKNLANLGLICQEREKFKTQDEFKKWWTIKFRNKTRIYVQKELTEIERYLLKFKDNWLGGTTHIKIEKEDFNAAVNSYTKNV